MNSKRNNTPRRKRLQRKVRIGLAIPWLKAYKGKSIITGYAKWFGIDKLCAIKELKMLGVAIPVKLEKQIIESITYMLQQKKEKKKAAPLENEDSLISDETFAFIAGYTAGGVPYGITHDDEIHNINTDLMYGCEPEENAE